MQMTNYRPIRDYRKCLIDASDYKNEFRTPVEELKDRYASIVEKLEEQSSSKMLKLVRRKGSKRIVKTLLLSTSVSQRLNQELPRIKRLSDDFDGFSAPQFRALLKIGGTSARKYINLLLASGIIKSDGKRWAAKYRWCANSTMVRL